MNDIKSALKSLNEAQAAISSTLSELSELVDKLEEKSVESDPNEHLGYLVVLFHPDLIVPVHREDFMSDGAYEGYEHEVMPTKKEALEAYLRTYEIFKIKQCIASMPVEKWAGFNEYGLWFIDAKNLRKSKEIPKNPVLYPLNRKSSEFVLHLMRAGELSLVPDNIDALREAANEL